MLSKFCLLSVSKQHISAVVCSAPARPYSQDIRNFKNPDVASLKRGSGGRSSFNGNVVTVFGGTGFIGRHLCNQLGKRGSQIIIPHRSDPDDYSVKRLKLVGDLGQVILQPFHLKDPLSIRKAIKYSNMVINLIGSDFETKNFSYFDVHVTGAKEIAKACREMNVARLVHFSSLNVTENPERYYLKKLQFLPSKLKGEQAVLEEFPDATIFRPGAVYGLCDRFLWPLCEGFRASSGSIPLYAKGEKTIRQPVFAHDVVMGVLNALNDNETKGKIYQAVGPERFYLKDIAVFCTQILQRPQVSPQLVHDIKFDPAFLAKLIICRYIIGFAMYHPMLNMCVEQIERESVTDEVKPGLPTLEDLGVVLSKLEEKIPHLILKCFLQNADYGREYSEFKPADSLSIKAVNPYE